MLELDLEPIPEFASAEKLPANTDEIQDVVQIHSETSYTNTFCSDEPSESRKTEASFHDRESVNSLKILTKKEAKRPAPQKLVKRPAGRNTDPRGGNQRTTKFGIGEGEGSGFQAAHVVLAANRIKANELRNKIAELTSEIQKLHQENLDMRHQVRMTERRLDHYERQEMEMPSMLQRYSEETYSLQKQIRRQRALGDAQDRKLRETEEELEIAYAHLRKLRTLADNQNLPAREELEKKLQKIETETAEKDRQIQNLERYVENLNKTHRHEMGVERVRQKETAQQVYELRMECERIHLMLKEKEKEMEVQNIYASRRLKRPNQPWSSPPSIGKDAHQPTVKPGAQKSRSGEINGKGLEELLVKNQNVLKNKEKDSKAPKKSLTTTETFKKLKAEYEKVKQDNEKVEYEGLNSLVEIDQELKGLLKEEKKLKKAAFQPRKSACDEFKAKLAKKKIEQMAAEKVELVEEAEMPEEKEPDDMGNPEFVNQLMEKLEILNNAEEELEQSGSSDESFLALLAKESSENSNTAYDIVSINSRKDQTQSDAIHENQIFSTGSRESMEEDEEDEEREESSSTNPDDILNPKAYLSSELLLKARLVPANSEETTQGNVSSIQIKVPPGHAYRELPASESDSTYTNIGESPEYELLSGNSRRISKLEMRELPENHAEIEYRDEFEDDEDLQDHEELEDHENHEELEDHEDLEVHENREDLEDHEEHESHEDLEDHAGHEDHEELEELEDHEDLEDHKEIEDHKKTSSTQITNLSNFSQSNRSQKKLPRSTVHNVPGNISKPADANITKQHDSGARAEKNKSSTSGAVTSFGRHIQPAVDEENETKFGDYKPSFIAGSGLLQKPNSLARERRNSKNSKDKPPPSKRK